MSHKVGALTLPASAPGANESFGDPGLDVLGDYFAACLIKYLGTAWIAVAPNEPIVRTIVKCDVEQFEFNENDLPSLCLFAENDQKPARVTDGFLENQDTLRIVWIPPPAPQIKAARRFPFFRAFKKVISLAVLHERDPGYVNASDSVTSTVTQTGLGPAVTLTGQASEDLAGRIEITLGGALGTAEFRWSKDGGATWFASGILTAATVALGTTGLTANFPAGTYVLATTYDWTSAVDAAAIAYGSDVHDLAGLDRWELQSFERGSIDIASGGETFSYPVYVANLLIVESTKSDETNAAWGLEPTVIRWDQTTGGADPLVTNEVKVPIEPDPP